MNTNFISNLSNMLAAQFENANHKVDFGDSEYMTGVLESFTDLDAYMQYVEESEGEGAYVERYNNAFGNFKVWLLNETVFYHLYEQSSETEKITLFLDLIFVLANNADDEEFVEELTKLAFAGCDEVFNKVILIKILYSGLYDMNMRNS